MYITLETDYAVRIVDSLAKNGGRMGAQAIAECSSVTLRFSLKILRKLVASGIVRSYKGAQGGYELARELEDITLNDILVTIEGPYVLNRCLKFGHVCQRNENDECPYHKLFDKISEDVQDTLKSANLLDILGKVPSDSSTR